MKYAVPAAAIGALSGVTLSNLISHDFTLVTASLIGSLSYLLVAVSLQPLALGLRKSLLGPGLFTIAITGSLLFLYTPIFIVLGRPDWFFNGWPFYLYIGSFGGLVGAIITHLVSLGAVQSKTKVYLLSLSIIIGVGFGISSILYYIGAIH